MKTLNYQEKFTLCVSFSGIEKHDKAAQLTANGFKFTSQQNEVAPMLTDYNIEVDGLQSFDKLNKIILS